MILSHNDQEIGLYMDKLAPPPAISEKGNLIRAAKEITIKLERGSFPAKFYRSKKELHTIRPPTKS